MKSSEWRHYRGHLIVKSRTAILGLRRFELWHGRVLLGTFRDVIRAEQHVDRRLGQRMQQA
jgi:hypothetical protein